MRRGAFCSLIFAIAVGISVAAFAHVQVAGAASGASGTHAVSGNSESDCLNPDWRAIASDRDRREPASRKSVARGQAATIVFLPGPLRSPEPLLLDDLAALPGFSVGLLSPTLGRYTPTQMMLDISQGSRVATGLYKPVTPTQPALMVNSEFDTARLRDWGSIVKRADKAPGEIRPGVLADAVKRGGEATANGQRGGGLVSYAGFDAAPTVTSIAAASSRCGWIDQLSLGSEASLPDRATELAAKSNLLVVAAPRGGQGEQLIKALSDASPQRLIVVVQTPPDPARNRLLAIGVRRPGEIGSLRSATTRRDGLVTATDIPATVLKAIGIPLPDDLQGQPIETTRPISVERLLQLNARMSLTAGRRFGFGTGVATLLLLFAALLCLIGKLTDRFRELSHLAMRLIALSMLWLPVLLLLTAALEPSGREEVRIVVTGTLVLAWLTDRFVAWPYAPALPAIVAVFVHAVDFAFYDSTLTGQSLLGPNPYYGARFYGVGNELESVLVVSLLIGTGAMMCGRWRTRASLGFAMSGLALAVVIGAGKLGADVGGVIMTAAGFGAAFLIALSARPSRLVIALVCATPVIALALLAVLDTFTSGDGHFTRTVLNADSTGSLLDIVKRRFEASWQGAREGNTIFYMILAVVLLGYAVVRRDRFFGPLECSGRPAANWPYRAGMAGGLAATVVGALANDSGPAILIISTFYLGFGALYMWGRKMAAAEPQLSSANSKDQRPTRALPAQSA